jgi:hypothetical protein
MNSDSNLQAAYRAATLSCPLGGEGCPTALEIAATARDELDSAQRERMLAIVANCARCAALVQLAGDLDTGSAPDAPDARVPSTHRPRPLRWLGASLAAALVLVAVLMTRPPSPSITRGGEGSVEPVPSATLSEAPAHFAWDAPADLACRVTVRSAAAEVVLESSALIGGRFEPDPDARARLGAGDYLWTADCGASRYGPYAFTVAP